MMHIFFCMVLSFVTFTSFAQEDVGEAARGYLPVPVTLDYQHSAQNFKVLTTTILGSNTTNLCESIEYRIAKSVEFTPNGIAGVPMLRATTSGASLNLGHNSLSLNRSNNCTSFGVGLEVGYSPNGLGARTQPHTIIVENGLFADWNIAILVHAGVRNVILRNLVLVDNTLPIAVIGRNSAPNILQSEVITVTLENVIIVNSNTDQLKCLNWVRSYLTDGTSVGTGVDTIAASNPCGYVQGELMPRENSPFTGVAASLEVYAGMYMYGVSNINIKNVSVSNIGFNGTPATLHTGSYGMWFRNCRSIFMEDVEATKVQSAVATAGLYFDTCDVVSIINAELSNNSTTQVTAPGVFAATPEQLWAAAVVLKDSNFINASDLVMSKTSAINNVWGLRTILATNAVLEHIEITRAWADGLRADRVYGIDLGDLYRNNGVTRLPAGSVQDGLLKGISISGSQGKNTQPSVATEFKGIYLGDGSSSMMVGNIYIENNTVAATSNGQNSGIEFGASSITSGATSTISNIVFNELAIRDNGAGITNDVNQFCGIRGVTGGSINLFKDIKLTNSYVQSNSGDGVRIADATGVIGGTVETLKMNNVLLDGNHSALRVGVLNQTSLLNSSFSKSTGAIAAVTIASTASTLGMDGCIITGNAAGGIAVVGAVQKLSINKSLISQNGADGILLQSTLGDGTIHETSISQNTGYGLRVENNVDTCFFKKSHFNQNGNAGLFFGGTVVNSILDGCFLNQNLNYGMSIVGAANSVTMKDCQASRNTGAADVYGIYINSGNSLQFNGVQCNENSAVAGNVVGLSLGSVVKLTMKNLELRGNTTSSGIAKGLDLVTVEHATMVRIDASRNVGTTAAYGVYVSLDVFSLQCDTVIASFNSADTNSATSITAGIIFLTSLHASSLKNISVQKNFAGAQAYGLYVLGAVGLTLEGVQAVGNRAFFSGNTAGFYQGVGIYLRSGDSIKLSRFRADNNMQDQQQSSFMYTDTTLTTLENEINTTSQLAHHFPVRNQAGGYGVFAQLTNNLVIENGSAVENNGARGYGIHARQCDNLKINSIDASANIGNAGVWADDTTPFTGTSSSVAQANNQTACLFGYQSGAGNSINLSQAYQYLLASLDEYAGFVTTQTTCNALCLLSQQTIASMYRIIWSTLAQFRRFSTGVGIGLLNCNNAQVNGCRVVGNNSMSDSAAGIALYASNRAPGGCAGIGQCPCSSQGSSISNCFIEGTDAWTTSRRGGSYYAINGSIDITEWLPLYTFLGVQTYDGTGTYNVQPIATLPGTMIPSGSPLNGITPPTATFTMNVPLTSSNTFSWKLNPRKMAVGFTPTTSTTLYDFSAPLPIAAGIVIESMTDCWVTDNTASLSKGNVGVGFGILADGALSSMFIDNKVTQNSADVLGQAWGIADMELTTPNSWYRNFLMANRVDTFLNYSYLVIFDPAIVMGQSFPLTIMYPGDISALNNQLPYDNIEVYLKTDRQISSSVNEFMAQGWNTAIPAGYGLMS